MNASIRTLTLGTALLASAVAAEDRSGEVPGLLVTLKSEKAGERAGSARTLGEIGPAAKAAVGDLGTALKDGDKEVRRCAAQALGDIGPAAASTAGALASALRDADWQVRRSAAYALGRLGTGDVESALKAARDDKQEAVRNAAKASLDRIKKLPKPQKTK
jgi:HEAT repeat protein